MKDSIWAHFEEKTSGYLSCTIAERFGLFAHFFVPFKWGRGREEGGDISKKIEVLFLTAA